MIGRDFYHDRSKFSSLQLESFILTGHDFQHERSKISYCLG